MHSILDTVVSKVHFLVILCYLESYAHKKEMTYETFKLLWLRNLLHSNPDRYSCALAMPGIEDFLYSSFLHQRECSSNQQS